MFQRAKCTALTWGVALVLAGCGADKKNGIDFYDPVPTDSGLQLIGDSYLDFESPKISPAYEAYIPSFLNHRASQYHGRDVIYKDRSVSGSKLDYILGGQYEGARLDGAQTLVVNGGANDLRVPCVASKVVDSNGNYVANDACEKAITSVKQQIETFFELVVSKNHVDQFGDPPDIIWLGRYHLPATVTHKSVVNRVNNIISGICNRQKYRSFCTYVDTRSAWTAEESVMYLLSSDEDPFASDGPIHVNDLGGQKITGILWDVLSNPSSDFYF